MNGFVHTRFRNAANWCGVLVCVFLSLVCVGCLISEQTGTNAPAGTGTFWGRERPVGDVTFHFRTIYNYLLVVLRLVVAVGLIWFTGRHMRKGGRDFRILVPAGVLAIGAVVICVQAVFAVFGYRIALNDEVLELNIPFELSLQVPWDEIQGAHILTTNWSREGDLRSTHLYTEWEELELVTTSDRHHIDLGRLSWEQRSNLCQAIIGRADLQDIASEIPRMLQP